MKASRSRLATVDPAARRGAAALHPLIGVKLWENPCWFSFRINFLSLQFNLPVYGWIERRYGLMRPEYVVLYALYLRDGITAQDIVASSGFPKNTLSRAVQRLLEKGSIRRSPNRTDLRSYVLHLTARGRRILDQTVPAMVARERAMLASLTASERQALSRLLAKLVMDFPQWPTRITEKEEPA